MLARTAALGVMIMCAAQPLRAETSQWPALLGWAGYIVANPGTTRVDVQRVREAIRELPDGDCRYPIRMANLRGTEGRVATQGDVLVGPPEIWISRLGANYLSKHPARLAGTIVHEAAHLEGASELDARRRQLEFLRHAAAGRGRRLGGYLRQFETDLAGRERLSRESPAFGFLLKPMAREQ